jgi:uncharacterized protein YhbP (UPF0306 family)
MPPAILNAAIVIPKKSRKYERRYKNNNKVTAKVSADARMAAFFSMVSVSCERQTFFKFISFSTRQRYDREYSCRKCLTRFI